jgi:hypothetical protein
LRAHNLFSVREKYAIRNPRDASHELTVDSRIAICMIDITVIEMAKSNQSTKKKLTTVRGMYDANEWIVHIRICI